MYVPAAVTVPLAAILKALPPPLSRKSAMSWLLAPWMVAATLPAPAAMLKLELVCCAAGLILMKSLPVVASKLFVQALRTPPF